MVMRNPVSSRWSQARHDPETDIVGRDAEIALTRPLRNVLGLCGLATTLYPGLGVQIAAHVALAQLDPAFWFTLTHWSPGDCCPTSASNVAARRRALPPRLHGKFAGFIQCPKHARSLHMTVAVCSAVRVLGTSMGPPATGSGWKDTMAEPDSLLDQMTLAEQVSLLSGEDFWSLPAISRLGIGKLRVTDGPNGARGGGSLVGGVKSAAFPVGIAIGSSWNPGLAREIGAALAQEVKSKGAHVSLSPTVNIQRSVTNGRNFECYSEDPVLTADLAVGFVEGLQGQGISAAIKHYVGNESEVERTTMSSDIDERTLREVYLVPFEAAVKRAGTWGIMSSYNKIGGTYASENHWTLSQVLRDDWGYDGAVMSDWFGSCATEPTVNAGLDLEMPGPTRDRGEKLIARWKLAGFRRQRCASGHATCCA